MHILKSLKILKKNTKKILLIISCISIFCISHAYHVCICYVCISRLHIYFCIFIFLHVMFSSITHYTFHFFLSDTYMHGLFFLHKWSCLLSHISYFVMWHANTLHIVVCHAMIWLPLRYAVPLPCHWIFALHMFACFAYLMLHVHICSISHVLSYRIFARPCRILFAMSFCMFNLIECIIVCTLLIVLSCITSCACFS